MTCSDVLWVRIEWHHQDVTAQSPEWGVGAQKSPRPLVSFHLSKVEESW